MFSPIFQLLIVSASNEVWFSLFRKVFFSVNDLL